MCLPFQTLLHRRKPFFFVVKMKHFSGSSEHVRPNGSVIRKKKKTSKKEEKYQHLAFGLMTSMMDFSGPQEWDPW